MAETAVIDFAEVSKHELLESSNLSLLVFDEIEFHGSSATGLVKVCWEYFLDFPHFSYAFTAEALGCAEVLWLPGWSEFSALA